MDMPQSHWQQLNPIGAPTLAVKETELALELLPRDLSPAVGLVVVRMSKCLANAKASTQGVPPGTGELRALVT
jgi:hypothetical protein